MVAGSFLIMAKGKRGAPTIQRLEGPVNKVGAHLVQLGMGAPDSLQWGLKTFVAL